MRFTDTGIGMTQEEIKRIFDAFAQGDHIEDGRHRFGGLGLGLAITRKLVEIQSGQIYAGSAGRDRGATFVIELPVTKNGTANSVLNENSSSNAVIFPSERSTRIFIS
jgi:signal transduction histidine kinase